MSGVITFTPPTYIDGLPVATSVSLSDILVVDQGGTPGTPGTATTRQATLSQILGIAGGYLPLPGGTMTGTIQFSSSKTWTGTSFATNPWISQDTNWTGTNTGSNPTSANYFFWRSTTRIPAPPQGTSSI
jgi:hypothetical protein